MGPGTANSSIISPQDLLPALVQQQLVSILPGAIPQASILLPVPQANTTGGLAASTNAAQEPGVASLQAPASALQYQAAGPQANPLLVATPQANTAPTLMLSEQQQAAIFAQLLQPAIMSTSSALSSFIQGGNAQQMAVPLQSLVLAEAFFFSRASATSSTGGETQPPVAADDTNQTSLPPGENLPP